MIEQDFGKGKLLAVGPPTTIPSGRSVDAIPRLEPSDRHACTCVYCRKIGIDNQTTPEYRQAENMSDPVHAPR